MPRLSGDRQLGRATPGWAEFDREWLRFFGSFKTQHDLWVNGFNGIQWDLMDQFFMDLMGFSVFGSKVIHRLGGKPTNHASAFFFDFRKSFPAISICTLRENNKTRKKVYETHSFVKAFPYMLFIVSVFLHRNPKSCSRTPQFHHTDINFTVAKIWDSNLDGYNTAVAFDYLHFVFLNPSFLTMSKL
jgi:hypothetical protein